MSDKTRRVTTTSHWRDDLDEAKQECNRILDIKVDDVIAEEEHDGWYLLSGTYSSFSVEHDESRSIYRCTRSKTLRFREYETGVRDRASTLVQFEVSEAVVAGSDNFFTSLPDALKPLLPSTTTIYAGPIVVERAPLLSIRFEAVTITKSNLRLSDTEELVGIPLSETVTIIPVSNCGSNISMEIHRKLEYTYTTGFRVELKTEVSTTLEFSGKLTFADGELGGSFSKQVTFSESKEYSSSTSETREESIDISVPPQTKAKIRLISQRFEARRSFNGPVVIDCDVLATYGPDYPPITHTIRHRLSALLQADATRSFIAEGTYANLDTRLQPTEALNEGC